MLGKILILLFLLASIRSVVRFSKARRKSDGLFAIFWISLAAYAYFDIKFLMVIPILSLVAASLAKARESEPGDSSSERRNETEKDSPLPTGNARKGEEEEDSKDPAQDAEADEDESLIPNIPELAEQWVTYGKMKGYSFDYSPESLREVDELISEEWTKNPPLFPQVTIMQIGSYVGEVIRRKHGGTWKESDDFGICLAKIGGQKDFRAFPFNKARKRIEEGEDDSVAFFYHAMVQTLEKDSEGE